VTFSDAANPSLGVVTLASSTTTSSSASLPLTTLLAVGSDSFTATYAPDAAATTAGFTSSSDTESVSVAKATTTTTLVSNLNPAQAGHAFTVTATIAPTTSLSTGESAPTGSVSFTIDGSSVGTIALSSGSAVLNVASLKAGTHTITATYTGDSNFSTSTATLTPAQVVSKLGSTTTAITSASTATFGQPITFTADVTASSSTSTAALSGYVQFTDTNSSGTTITLGDAQVVQGVATLTTRNVPAGSTSVTATYEGNKNYASSTSTALPETISTQTSTVTVTGNNPAAFGQMLKLNIQVAGPNSTNPGGHGIFGFLASIFQHLSAPTGTVTITDTFTPSGSTTPVLTVLGQATVHNGDANFSTSTLAIGTHSLLISYSGDSNYSSSTTTLSEVIANAATVSLSTSANSVTQGTGVTFSVTVAAGTGSTSTAAPTGTVTLVDESHGGATIGTITLVSGTGTFTLSSLSSGSHDIVAEYSGDANYAVASANTVEQILFSQSGDWWNRGGHGSRGGYGGGFFGFF
jgi:hypothetical protein